MRALLPLTTWLLAAAFILAPLGAFLLYGFFALENGVVAKTPTLATLREALATPEYRATFLGTLALGATVALANLVIGYAVALFIWRRRGATRLVLLAAVGAPLLMSYVIKIYAMRTVLGTNGILNVVLLELGLVAAPVQAFLFNMTAVTITLVVVLLPFAVLPTFLALDRVPPSVLQAARDLGAGEADTFRRVVLPMSLPGAIVGALATFILAAGDFLVPELVGGIDGFTYGRLVFSQFGLAYNWPLGAALSIVLLAVALVVIVAARRISAPQWQIAGAR